VHPLPPPGDRTDWDWTQRTVLAAAMILASLDRELLLELLNGPMDWSVWASALALSAEASSDPAFERKVTPELLSAASHYEKIAIGEFVHPLYAAVLDLPNLDPKIREAINKKLSALHDD
jgi:hypothetical protein